MSHYNATPAIDIFGSVQGTDLGYVAAQIDKIVAIGEEGSAQRLARRGARARSQTMKASFNGLLIGLVGAIVLVYMLIVVNFQSLLDPFIIITALPAALGRHRLDAVPDPYHRQRAGAHRRDHVHGGRHRQQRAGGQLRARAHERRRQCVRGGAAGRLHAVAAGVDDGDWR